MKEEPLEIKSKTTRRQMKEFVLRLGKDTQFNFNHFGLINKNTIEKIVENEIKRQDKMKFFGMIEGQIAGYGFLTKFSKTTKKHNCTLGIVVLDSFQNKGIGKQLCKNMIKKAWEKGFTKIWLNVFLDNKHAYKLYRTLGFEIEGIFIDEEIQNKRKRHVISMALIKNKKMSFSERVKIVKNLEQST